MFSARLNAYADSTNAGAAFSAPSPPPPPPPREPSTTCPAAFDSACVPRPSVADGRVPLPTEPASAIDPPLSASASDGTLIPSGSSSLRCTA